MKKTKFTAIFISIIAFIFVLSACGSSSGSSNGRKVDDGYYYEETTASAAYTGDFEAAAEAYYDSGAVEETAAPSEHTAKIIHTADITMQSTEFDTAMENIDAQVAAVQGAYYESRSISTESRNYRYADMVIRVPSKELGGFTDKLHEIGTITYEVQSAQDVSDYYYDTESRLTTAKTKLERLHELLAKAEDMESIIQLEEAISDTEYEIDSLQGTLKYYDSRIDYSTVTLRLSEVAKVEPTETPKTFGEKLSAAFSDGIEAFKDGLGDFVIWLAENWTALLLIIVIFILPPIIIVTSVRKSVKKRRLKSLKAESEKTSEKSIAASDKSEKDD